MLGVDGPLVHQWATEDRLPTFQKSAWRVRAELPGAAPHDHRAELDQHRHKAWPRTMASLTSIRKRPALRWTSPLRRSMRAGSIPRGLPRGSSFYPDMLAEPLWSVAELPGKLTIMMSGAGRATAQPGKALVAPVASRPGCGSNCWRMQPLGETRRFRLRGAALQPP